MKQRAFIKKTTLCVAVAIAVMAESPVLAQNAMSGADVPAGEAGRFFMPGAAAKRDAISPSSFSTRLSVGINPRAGLKMSCGELDFWINIDAEMKRLERRLKDTVKEAQAKIMASISGAISSFFQYALMKINPVLGQLTTKQLDEQLELFELNIKQCQDYERDVKNGRNPFGEIIQVAVGEEWRHSIGLVDSKEAALDEVEEEMMKEARKKGVTMFDGQRYGGEGQDPINMTKGIIEAGMNLNLGRSDKGQWKAPFGKGSGGTNEKDHPVLSSFESAEKMYEFVEDVYGSMEIKIGKDAAEQTEVVQSVPGRGYEVLYGEYRDGYIEALRKYVNGEMQREEFEKKFEIIPPAEVDDLRGLPPYQLTMEIESRGQQFGIHKMRNNLLFVKQALKTGIYAPDIQLSGIRETAESTYRNLYYRILDDIREIGQRAYQF